MAAKHPYVPSLSAIVQVFDQLKKSFPTPLNSDKLKQLSLAPNTEGSVINLVRFLGLIDEQNARTEIASRIFTLHDQEEFQAEFSAVIQAAYSELFSLYGDEAWTTEQTRLITFFRRSDQTTERVGLEQARTFKTLAAYAGHGESPVQPRAKVERAERPRRVKKPQVVQPVEGKVETPPAKSPIVQLQEPSERNFGLTVRIEINLPVAPDQETYDRIFASIRENLLNGK